MDALEQEAGPKVRERVSQAATILDIGRSIDYYRRYEHTADILTESDLAGFSHRKLALLAAVIRQAGDEKMKVSVYRPLLGPDDRDPVARQATFVAIADEVEQRIAPGKALPVEFEERRREVIARVPLFDRYRQAPGFRAAGLGRPATFGHRPQHLGRRHPPEDTPPYRLPFGQAQTRHAAFLHLDRHSALAPGEQQGGQLAEVRLVPDQRQRRTAAVGPELPDSVGRSAICLERPAGFRGRPPRLLGQDLSGAPGPRVGTGQHDIDSLHDCLQPSSRRLKSRFTLGAERPVGIVRPPVRIAVEGDGMSNEEQVQSVLLLSGPRSLGRRARRGRRANGHPLLQVPPQLLPGSAPNLRIHVGEARPKVATPLRVPLGEHAEGEHAHR